jgi:hypothetical protein
MDAPSPDEVPAAPYGDPFEASADTLAPESSVRPPEPTPAAETESSISSSWQ